MIKNADRIRIEDSVLEEMRALRATVEGLVSDYGKLSRRTTDVMNAFLSTEASMKNDIKLWRDEFVERMDRMDTDLSELEKEWDDIQWVADNGG